jgi:hypothetical protein
MQFKIRTLFILTTIVALLVWLFYVPPYWLGLFILQLLYSLLPAVIVSGIVYCRGAWQAFFIGAAPWTATSSLLVALFWVGSQQYQWFPSDWPYNASGEEIFFVKAILAVPLMIAAVSGLIGVGIRAWALSMHRADHSPDHARGIL